LRSESKKETQNVARAAVTGAVLTQDFDFQVEQQETAGI
jgi:hypothetical protein